MPSPTDWDSGKKKEGAKKKTREMREGSEPDAKKSPPNEWPKKG